MKENETRQQEGDKQQTIRERENDRKRQWTCFTRYQKGSYIEPKRQARPVVII